ncbi:MAG TPA: YsnF/AvaK domain-containing protein [Longimicrobium sp.]|uniref:YsnF/AvaK domain-containing protein n=1 Tax=Longimicrobium sp. TaxID=2029185 RepID=UPI002ED958AF
MANEQGGGGGVEDVRGWLVIAGDGTMLGTVMDMVAEQGATEPAFLAIALDASVARRPGGKTVYVPRSAVRLDPVVSRVHLDGVTGEAAPGLPTEPTDGPVAALHSNEVAPAAPLAAPAQATAVVDGEARMVVSQEELKVGKRLVEAGEVRIRKHVEAEQVRESISVMREDVTVERRAAPPGVGMEPRTEGDTLYVPIVEEEIVVTKRLVVREELVIRKRQVMEEQVIQETLHHERAEILGPDDVGDAPR